MRKCLFIFAVCMLLVQSSCKVIYPNLMFREKDYQYLEMGQSMLTQYLIQEGDEFTLQMYSRDGFKLIDVLGQGNQNNGIRNQNNLGVQFLVDANGMVELPILGQLLVKGLTEQELESRLEEEYARYFNEPYAILRVSNRRCFLFKGSTGSVVSLNRAPTTILEVIAKSGGLSSELKAYNIKILRGDMQAPELIEIDLSSISGLKDAELIVQGNDVIYIEERKRLANGLVATITPILGLISTILASYALLKTVGGN